MADFSFRKTFPKTDAALQNTLKALRAEKVFTEQTMQQCYADIKEQLRQAVGSFKKSQELVPLEEMQLRVPTAELKKDFYFSIDTILTTNGVAKEVSRRSAMALVDGLYNEMFPELAPTPRTPAKTIVAEGKGAIKPVIIQQR